MMNAFSTVGRLVALPPALMLLLAACSSPNSNASAGGTPFSGDIVSAQQGSFVVRSTDGTERTIKIDAKTKIMEVSPASLTDIKANSFVGATATPSSDGTLSATEVHIFDERLRGVGEGHRTLPEGDQSSMTNGTAEATMTNGAAAMARTAGAAPGGTKASSGAQLMTLRYKGGEQKITVSAAVPVVFIAPGNIGLLLPKAHVVIVPGGSSETQDSASIVKVGKGNFVPPQ